MLGLPFLQNPEGGSSVFLRNFDIYMQVHKVLKFTIQKKPTSTKLKTDSIFHAALKHVKEQYCVKCSSIDVT
jgi:hypothetical protein